MSPDNIPAIYLRCDVAPDDELPEQLQGRLLKEIGKSQARVERGVPLSVDEYQDAISAAIELGRHF